MNEGLRRSFLAWLKQQPDISADSAKSYAGSYLTRAFQAWDSNASFMVPIENYVSVMMGNVDYQNVFRLLCQELERQIFSEIERGRISQRYGDNIRVSIHHFEEFVSAVSMQAGKSVLLSHSSIVIPAPQDIIKRISDKE